MKNLFIKKVQEKGTHLKDCWGKESLTLNKDFYIVNEVKKDKNIYSEKFSEKPLKHFDFTYHILQNHNFQYTKFKKFLQLFDIEPNQEKLEAFSNNFYQEEVYDNSQMEYTEFISIIYYKEKVIGYLVIKGTSGSFSYIDNFYFIDYDTCEEILEKYSDTFEYKHDTLDLLSIKNDLGFEFYMDFEIYPEEGIFFKTNYKRESIKDKDKYIKQGITFTYINNFKERK